MTSIVVHRADRPGYIDPEARSNTVTNGTDIRVGQRTDGTPSVSRIEAAHVKGLTRRSGKTFSRWAAQRYGTEVGW